MSHERIWTLLGHGGDRVLLAWRPLKEPRGHRVRARELLTLIGTWLSDSSTERVLREIHAWARPSPEVWGAADTGALRGFLATAAREELLVAYREPFRPRAIPALPDRPEPPEPKPPVERLVEDT